MKKESLKERYVRLRIEGSIRYNWTISSGEQECLDSILKEIHDEQSKLTKWQRFKKKFWSIVDVMGYYQ